MKRLSLLIVLVCCLLIHPSLFSSQKDSGELRLAIGIATPGGGAQLMGHLFLYISPKDSLVQEGRVFEFNIDRSDNILETNENGKQDPIKKFLGMGSRFYLNEYIAGIKTLKYRLENRSVFYYFLDLPQSDIKALLETLELEKKRRREIKNYDYNVFFSSCLTQMLRILNPYLQKNSYPPIQFFDVEKKFSKWKEFFSAYTLYIENAPFIVAPKLASHPAVYKIEKVFPELVAEVDLLMDFREQIEKLDTHCKYNGEVAGLFDYILLNDEMLYQDSLFKLFQQISSECGRSDLFNEVIFMWYLYADKTLDKIKIEEQFSREMSL